MIISITITVLITIYMLFRNEWVYKKQMKINFNDKSYWSYDKMFWHFWIWDVEEMRNK